MNVTVVLHAEFDLDNVNPPETEDGLLVFWHKDDGSVAAALPKAAVDYWIARAPAPPPPEEVNA